MENPGDSKVGFRGEKSSRQNELTIPKTVNDKQRIAIGRLMKRPEKPVHIPDRPKEWKTREPPEFVRDVMGSSAGAGSGEFHVYRGYRRREYTRQMYIQTKAEQEEQQDEFHKRLEENQAKADEKTAKRRNKRMKRKQKINQKKKQKVEEAEQEEKDKQKSGSDDHQSEQSSGSEEGGDVEENCFVIGGR